MKSYSVLSVVRDANKFLSELSPLASLRMVDFDALKAGCPQASRQFCDIGLDFMTDSTKREQYVILTVAQRIIGEAGYAAIRDSVNISRRISGRYEKLEKLYAQLRKRDGETDFAETVHWAGVEAKLARAIVAYADRDEVDEFAMKAYTLALAHSNDILTFITHEMGLEAGFDDVIFWENGEWDVEGTYPVLRGVYPRYIYIDNPYFNTERDESWKNRKLINLSRLFQRDVETLHRRLYFSGNTTSLDAGTANGDGEYITLRDLLTCDDDIISRGGMAGRVDAAITAKEIKEILPSGMLQALANADAKGIHDVPLFEAGLQAISTAIKIKSNRLSRDVERLLAFGADFYGKDIELMRDKVLAKAKHIKYRDGADIAKAKVEETEKTKKQSAEQLKRLKSKILHGQPIKASDRERLTPQDKRRLTSFLKEHTTPIFR